MKTNSVLIASIFTISSFSFCVANAADGGLYFNQTTNAGLYLNGPGNGWFNGGQYNAPVFNGTLTTRTGQSSILAENNLYGSLSVPKGKTGKDSYAGVNIQLMQNAVANHGPNYTGSNTEQTVGVSAYAGPGASASGGVNSRTNANSQLFQNQRKPTQPSVPKG